MGKDYPILLDLAGKKVLVVGGGKVALRKVNGLLNMNCNISVISPELIDDLRLLVEQGLITHHQRKYHNGDLEGNDLVFAATDDRLINIQIYEEGQKKKILVNNVTSCKSSDFTLPAVYKNKHFTVSFSTNGKNPFYAKYMKELMENLCTKEVEMLFEVLNKYRNKCVNEIASDAEKKKFMNFVHSKLPSNFAGLREISPQWILQYEERLSQEYQKMTKKGE